MFTLRFMTNQQVGLIIAKHFHTVFISTLNLAGKMFPIIRSPMIGSWREFWVSWAWFRILFGVCPVCIPITGSEENLVPNERVSDIPLAAAMPSYLWLDTLENSGSNERDSTILLAAAISALAWFVSVESLDCNELGSETSYLLGCYVCLPVIGSWGEFWLQWTWFWHPVGGRNVR
jgi:hypothetical protein